MFGVFMLVYGYGDGFVIGVICKLVYVFELINYVFDVILKLGVVGVLVVLNKGCIVLMVDILVYEWLDEEDLVDIVECGVVVVCDFGFDLCVVFVLFLIFGYLILEWVIKMNVVFKVLD